jgi:hypothetical protein
MIIEIVFIKLVKFSFYYVIEFFSIKRFDINLKHCCHHHL